LLEKSSEWLSLGAENTTEKAASESLTKSREEIRIITRSILDLVNARQKASLQVSGNKELLGASIANPEVERRVIADAIEHAKAIGLDEDLAKGIVEELIKYSKLIQAEDVYKRQTQKFLEERKIRLISIVGAGRMGTWFARYFRDLSAKVSLYDERKSKAKEKALELGVNHVEELDALSESDLVIISAPISKTPAIVRDLFNYKKARPLQIIEVSSVKSEMGSAGLLNEESQNHGSILYSIHPLFGGLAKSYEQNCLIQTFPKDTTLIRGLFPHFTIVSLDWRQHDTLMGVFLTLPHALALVFADAIPEDWELWKSAAGLSSPSYLRMLELSKKVFSEDPEIYFEIQASNPNSKEMLANAVNALLKIEKALKSRADFVQFFGEAKRSIDQLDELRS
jgi:prephenate dehydrogenase/chorismate mutase